MATVRKSIYKGQIIDVSIDTVVLPNAQSCDLEIVRHPGGAAVVALDAADRVCLLRQYRYAANGWLWELPAGKRDDQEEPLCTAQRELAEEAGVHASEWYSLDAVISSPGVFTEVIYLYLARELTPVSPNTEEHEVLEVHWLPLEQALAWAVGGQIQDAKTLVGLFRAQAHRKT